MIELTVEQQALQALARALDSEADGKKLRRDLSKTLREAMEPLKKEAQGNVRSLRATVVMRSNKTRDKSGRFVTLGGREASLRDAVASAVKAEGRLSGKATGARLRVPRKGMPRGFNNAARRLNRKSGWRHPVFGGSGWVQQTASPPGWFDRATNNPKVVQESKLRVLDAMEQMAHRIINGLR